MREYLFREKTLKNDDTYDKPGQWAYGYFVNCASMYDDPEKDRVAELIDLDADRIYGGEYNPWDVHIVERNTVSQWTGLVDKNGVKIFEGDIVVYKDGMATVQYNLTHASFLLLERSAVMGLRYFYLDEIITNTCNVIGNIWDNPELGVRDESE